MSAIRVMLGNMPAMLHGILEETFAGQRDIMLVHPFHAPGTLSESIASERPDVLVVGVQLADRVDDFAGLFSENPSLRILAIGEDARSATMHELFLRRWRVADLTPRSIVNAVYALHSADAALDEAPTEPRR
ncbi:MAG TPA: hypothetical protein VIP11_12600 [Gemmatimonadaceae bacterium]